MNFIQDNFSTIVIGAVVLGLVSFITIRLFLAKAKGKSGCSCGCENCKE